MTSHRLSETGVFDIVEPGSTRAATIDIGGTNNQSAYRSFKTFARAVFFNEIGTWNATDDLDECRFQQATDTSGGSVKDLTTDASGGNYDTDNPVDADGNFVIIEVRGEDFDVDATTPFDSSRGYHAEAGNSGQDDCFGTVVYYTSGYGRKELQGAASVGAQVYVDPNT